MKQMDMKEVTIRCSRCGEAVFYFGNIAKEDCSNMNGKLEKIIFIGGSRDGQYGIYPKSTESLILNSGTEEEELYSRASYSQDLDAIIFNLEESK